MLKLLENWSNSLAPSSQMTSKLLSSESKTDLVVFFLELIFHPCRHVKLPLSMQCRWKKFWSTTRSVQSTLLKYIQLTKLAIVLDLALTMVILLFRKNLWFSPSIAPRFDSLSFRPLLYTTCNSSSQTSRETQKMRLSKSFHKCSDFSLNGMAAEKLVWERQREQERNTRTTSGSTLQNPYMGVNIRTTSGSTVQKSIHGRSTFIVSFKTEDSESDQITSRPM